MAKKNQHVVPKDDGWAVRGERNQHATSIHPTQEAARRAAVEIAKNQQSEVLIHGQDGKIRARETYGKDPFPPRDTEH